MLIWKGTKWDGQTDKQTNRPNREGVQMLFTCTAPPISLRVYLLAVAARETRFHARELAASSKKEEGRRWWWWWWWWGGR